LREKPGSFSAEVDGVAVSLVAAVVDGATG
jgi:hypothetical protein